MAAAERRALADLLAGLSAADWESPSLCEGWTVRVVVAHLVAALAQGRGVDLLMAACGRRDALLDLSGDGATVLAERLHRP